jgi:hypothetical protein
MRLNLSWRNWDLIDVELHLVRRHDEDDDVPTLHASGSANIERADSYGDPETIVGFGFQR